MSLARRLLLALWAGALVAVGGLVAPTLFAILPDRHLAGFIAGELFRRLTLGSFIVALALVLIGGGAGAAGRPARRLLPLVPAALLAFSEYAVRPLLEAARAGAGAGSPAFIAWHGVSTLLYLAATVVAVWLLVRELKHAA